MDSITTKEAISDKIMAMDMARAEIGGHRHRCHLQGGLDVFYGRLLEAMRVRAWEVVPMVAPASGTSAVEGLPAEEDLAIRMPVVGVSGILRMEQEVWESEGQNLQDAFQDLNDLMSKAKEMELAEKMRQKLLTNSSTQSNSNNEEMGSKQDM